MRTITCNHCGCSIGEDDFSLMTCPVCDSFMDLNRLNKKVNPELEKVIRLDSCIKLEKNSVGRFG